MNWFKNFITSSIGKKFLMALTGLLLCLYLVIHVAGNLTLYGGATTFNHYVATLGGIKPLVRVIEFFLVILFLAHILNGIRLTIENRRATAQKYRLDKPEERSSLTSRTMMITGSILLLFLVVHLSTFWYQFQVHHEDGQFYQIVTSASYGFDNLLFTLLYMVAMVLLGFHLHHGFQSAFQTLGWLNSKYKTLIQVIAAIFWLIIPLCFLSIPVYFGLFGGGH